MKFLKSGEEVLKIRKVASCDNTNYYLFNLFGAIQLLLMKPKLLNKLIFCESDIVLWKFLCMNDSTKIITRTRVKEIQGTMIFKRRVFFLLMFFKVQCSSA